MLDASVVANLLFGDEGAQDIGRWIFDNLSTAIVSDIAWGETVGALGIRVRRGDADAAEAKSVLDEFSNDVASWARSGIISQDIAVATGYVGDFSLPLRFVDAIHVAVARRLDATVITTDRQQFRAARKLGVSAINPLEQPT
ncbi:type II toxin-antitoxin system VapC family toxin [Sphingomonas sp. PB4P5]|uniref:type II toxin-antitoxin system VapC family toxin n=1 Tax=Parasphingomonas puruogangriensis TaxID=3096155 RepID=UPI002FC6AD7A